MAAVDRDFRAINLEAADHQTPVSADVVGYSRLTGADEEGTIGRVQALRREIIDPAITAHHGRIVKTTGDGVLSSSRA